MIICILIRYLEKNVNLYNIKCWNILVYNSIIKLFLFGYVYVNICLKIYIIVYENILKVMYKMFYFCEFFKIMIWMVLFKKKIRWML